ncbi:hypothetical protein LguiB_023903 [Lonicera macranthoides]
MELGLSLGSDPSKPFVGLSSSKARDISTTNNNKLGICMTLGLNSNERQEDEESRKRNEVETDSDPPVQLDLLPLVPVPRSASSNQQRWSSGSSEGGSSGNVGFPAAAAARGFDVNRTPVAGGEEVSSPNSVASSFQMDFGIFRRGNNKRDSAGNDVVEGGERASSRASDEDENALARKKLRLSKEQSAFLEESFKEHNTLNPKQKLALAKQLNLRPRQVEVWFQNRRARTKLKQTEVDCEYLKRCCETLTEENRRLHKELQELRALKTSNPFYMQLPATTLTMCPSCERVATTTTTGAPPTATTTTTSTAAKPVASKPTPTPTTTTTTALTLSRQRLIYPFSNTTANNHPHQSAAS